MMSVSIKDLINELKKCPELYIGQKSLSLLEAYINGWLNRDVYSVTDLNLIGEFQDWIAEKYQIRITQSWARIILFHSLSEYDALDRFFELFDEFINQSGKV